MGDSFGDRMKMYEAQETGRRFLPLLPVYARIDGRSFSKFTKGMDRPFDKRMVDAMVSTTKHLVKETNAVIGYTQSDEISLAWYSDSVDSKIFFDGKIYKMTSVLASMAASAFAHSCLFDNDMSDRFKRLLPCFDARVFQLPNQVECANAFLWREQDATKNAISMAARAYFSHKQLHKKSGPEMQEMLFQEHGINFNDYPTFFKRGRFVRREVQDVELPMDEYLAIPEKHRPESNTFKRTTVQEIAVPKFSTVTNRVDVIFNGADPIVEKSA